MTEVLKHHHNRGLRPNLAFYRDMQGLECDLLWQSANGIHAFEMKSGTTVNPSHFKAINRVADGIPAVSGKFVVHGGTDRQTRSGCEVVPFLRLDEVLRELQPDTVSTRHTVDSAIPNQEPDLLDRVFHSLVAPVLKAVDETLQPLGRLVFESVRHADLIRRGPSRIEWEGMLGSSAWPQTKTRFLLPKLNLRDEVLILGRTSRFGANREDGTQRFAIELKGAYIPDYAVGATGHNPVHLCYNDVLQTREPG